MDMEKICPKCGNIMDLEDEIMADECAHGDIFDGDYELGSTRVVYYLCRNSNCNYEEIISSEFKGSGILR